MFVSPWTPENTKVAERYWSEYQKSHDLSSRIGQTAGIDPITGQIWFGESIQDVVAQRDAVGLSSPLRFERVGSATYYVKGGRQTTAA
jgi:hypothetical protein